MNKAVQFSPVREEPTKSTVDEVEVEETTSPEVDADEEQEGTEIPE